LQTAIGNDAAQRRPETKAEDLGASSLSKESTRFAHGFSRVQLNPAIEGKPGREPSAPTTFASFRAPIAAGQGSMASGLAGCRPFATRTTVLSRDGDVVTESANGAGAAPATPAATNHCALRGATFATVPSGTIAAALNGSKLEGAFQIRADFDTAIPCTCACGEYRQYVRGTFTANGKAVTHQLGPGRVLDPTTFQEDGDFGLGTAYGYRSKRGTKSRFTPDQAGGCRFEGEDEPGISSSSGAQVAMDLDFRGDLIDTCSGNSVATSASWSVAGSATIP
jgi:hypothetical protein